MPKSILLGYATVYGSTREVAEVIAACLSEHGQNANLQLLKDVRSLSGYQAVVIGAPLIMYRWHKDALRFLSRYRKNLAELPVAIFALGPVKEPHNEKEWQDSRAQLDKELAKFPWLKPIDMVMFGGKFDPAALRFPLNKFAGKEPASDARDWAAIRNWASNLVTSLE